MTIQTKNTLDKNEIATLSASLRPIERNILKEDSHQGTKRIWFQGAEPYFDIFFELKDDEIVWFQFTLRGRSLSWDRKTRRWETGNTNELRVDDISFYPASKTIDNHDRIDREFIDLVISILELKAEEAIFAKVLALFDREELKVRS